MSSYSIHSHQTLPEQIVSENNPACILGIDEAGRGPILGSMVYGIAYCPVVCKEKLKQIGFDDSKKLTEEQRDDLFEVIKSSDVQQWLAYSCTVLTPQDISRKMLRRSKYNLNQLSFDTAIDLVKQTLNKGVNVQELYVDTVGSAQKYQELLSKTFPGIGKIVVESKADAKFPIVSAASICAKVTRDQQLRDWTWPEIGFKSVGDLGSGYPSDPTTKQWLKDNMDPLFGFPSLVRFSWSTCYNLLDEVAIKVHWPYEDEDNEENDYNSKKRKQPKQTKIFQDKQKDDPWKTKSQFMQSIKAYNISEI